MQEDVVELRKLLQVERKVNQVQKEMAEQKVRAVEQSAAEAINHESQARVEAEETTQRTQSQVYTPHSNIVCTSL